MGKVKSIAIVGAGPRGLSALENLYLELAQVASTPQIKVLLFEKTTHLGSGPIYRTDQVSSNWLNVSERALTLNERPAISIGEIVIPVFAAYQEWSGFNSDETKVDYFPPRARLGQYLRERYQSISEVLQTANLLTVIHARVEEIELTTTGVNLVVDNGNAYSVSEVTLAIGHQATASSTQMQQWVNFASDHNKFTLFKEPYPIESLLLSKKINSNTIVALRGFGLAMIDVARGIVEGLGGRFIIQDENTQAMTYEDSERTPRRIIPFSLDGLPLAPKPLNKTIDNWFRPTPSQFKKFRANLRDTLSRDSITDNTFLILAIAEVGSEIFFHLGKRTHKHSLAKEAISGLIESWLKDMDFRHALIIPHNQSPEKSIQAFVGMATGRASISLDYCIGQVWRHFQPTMYEILSFSGWEGEIIASLIGLDERMKRYAYGPPVASLQQLLALHAAGIMSFKVIDDPDIGMNEQGWEFNSDGDNFMVDIIINTVLDDPKLLEICTPLVQKLLANDLIQPIHEKLGVLTDQQGYVIAKDLEKKIPIAVLGRLAKGTLIGVDAILECFGSRINAWAKRAVRNQ